MESDSKHILPSSANLHFTLCFDANGSRERKCTKDCTHPSHDSTVPLQLEDLNGRETRYLTEDLKFQSRYDSVEFNVVLFIWSRPSWFCRSVIDKIIRLVHYLC